jgi:hypothetical protein
MTTLFRRGNRIDGGDQTDRLAALPRVLPNTIAIPASRLWSSSSRPGPLLIRCVAGQVWVTQAGSARDVVLEAEQSFATAGVGKVVVQAITNANIHVMRDAPTVC